MINQQARTVGPQSKLTAQYAKLIAMEEALDMFKSSLGQANYQRVHKLIIYGDCKSALKALQDRRRQSGQSVLRRILEKLQSILEKLQSIYTFS